MIIPELEKEMREFLARHPIHTQKMNERPWGSYNVALCYDPPVGFMDGNMAFGSAFSIEEATILVMMRYASRVPEDPNFSQMLGPVRLAELRGILSKYPQPHELVTGEVPAAQFPETEPTLTGSIDSEST